MEWGPYFTEAEFACSHCGKGPVDSLRWIGILRELNILRGRCDFPFRVSSGYRCLLHPDEERKGRDAIHAHTHGAVDILVSGARAGVLLERAFSQHCSHTGDPIWTGVGVNQRGGYDQRFVHLDMMIRGDSPSNVIVWSY